VLPELNCSAPAFGGLGSSNGTEPAGYNSIDRYRHGKYPSVLADGITFDDKRGQVKYHILFGDGHVSGLVDIATGVRAIQMRDP
jgi:prepilin-type processing-associated H-X9-DG protein